MAYTLPLSLKQWDAYVPVTARTTYTRSPSWDHNPQCQCTKLLYWWGYVGFAAYPHVMHFAAGGHDNTSTVAAWGVREWGFHSVGACPNVDIERVDAREIQGHDNLWTNAGRVTANEATPTDMRGLPAQKMALVSPHPSLNSHAIPPGRQTPPR